MIRTGFLEFKEHYKNTHSTSAEKYFRFIIKIDARIHKVNEKEN